MITIPRKIREVRIAGVKSDEILYTMTKNKMYKVNGTAEAMFDNYLLTKDKKSFGPMFKQLTACKDYPLGIDFEDFVDACYSRVGKPN
jgi:hypothetical protein